MFAHIPPKKLRASPIRANSSILKYMLIIIKLKFITDVLAANLKKLPAKFHRMHGTLRIFQKSRTMSLNPGTGSTCTEVAASAFLSVYYPLKGSPMTTIPMRPKPVKIAPIS